MPLATDQREAADERHQSDQTSARLGGTDLFRGAMVILAAVIIGGLVVSRGIDDDADGVGVDAETAEVDPAATATDGTDTTDTTSLTEETDPATGAAIGTDASTTPTAPAADSMSSDTSETTATTVTPLDTILAPSEVRTVVLNAGGPQGIAGRATELLQGASYITSAAKNADLNGPSVIYYIEGYDDEALALASVFGPGLDALVQPLDPANPPTDDLQDAAVIVVVGNDGVIVVP